MTSFRRHSAQTNSTAAQQAMLYCLWCSNMILHKACHGKKEKEGISAAAIQTVGKHIMQ